MKTVFQKHPPNIHASDVVCFNLNPVTFDFLIFNDTLAAQYKFSIQNLIKTYSKDKDSTNNSNQASTKSIVKIALGYTKIQVKRNRYHNKRKISLFE